MSRAAYKQELIDRYREAYHELNGIHPQVTETKGFIWINETGGYLLEELEEMAAVLASRLEEARPVTP